MIPPEYDRKPSRANSDISSHAHVHVHALCMHMYYLTNILVNVVPLLLPRDLFFKCALSRHARAAETSGRQEERAGGAARQPNRRAAHAARG